MALGHMDIRNKSEYDNKKDSSPEAQNDGVIFCLQLEEKSGIMVGLDKVQWELFHPWRG